MALVKENAHAEFTQTVRIEKLPTISAPASTTTTLTKNDSGKVVLLAPNAAVCVLPAPIVGMHFTVIHTGAFDTTKSEVRTDAGTTLFRGGSNSRDGGDTATPGANDDRIEFLATTVAGDHVEVICISTTEWMVRGSSKTTTSITYTDGGA
tara:strand:- start:90 stop:542 length:453 start_codon:yes stop_codon:yes gene_type:complete